MATTTAAAHFAKHSEQGQTRRGGAISGLILETPFVSIRDMLVTLYPQRWLPYRYLWPFLWNWWDSEVALRVIANARVRPSILIVQAGKDEVVPLEQTDRLEELCKDMALDVSRKSVGGAFHTEVLARGEGRIIIQKFLKEIH